MNGRIRCLSPGSLGLGYTGGGGVNSRALAGFVLGVAALLASSLVPLPASVQAQGSTPSGAREVQVRARRLASGNVEFGLRVTNPADGSASYLTLIHRFLLYNHSRTVVGKWYYSEVVKVGVGAGATLVEVRARRLASGNVEFGLRLFKKTVWLPRFRYLIYGSARPGGPWQYSSVFTTLTSPPPSGGVSPSPPPSGGVSPSPSPFAVGSRCASGTPVPNPAHNPGLVNDCIALLNAKPHLSQLPDFAADPISGVNWGSSRPITAWNGVYLSSTNPKRVNRVKIRGLTSGIPSEFGELNALEELNLFDGRLSGSIPSKLGRLTNLKYLIIAGLNNQSSRLTGSIPSSLCRLQSLERLELTYHDLNGPIPSCLGSLSKLEWLELRRNDLSGQIPSTLGSLSDLEKLHLHDNDLSGSIPASLGSLSNITHLNLADNDLSGTVPSSLLSSFADLVNLDLSGNSLSSWAPSSLSGIHSVSGVTLDLSDNDLSGQVPATLGTLSNAGGNVYVLLSGNQFSGAIPPELANITQLFSLNLSGNNLTGGIPSALVSHANLGYLNVSDNALSGAVPHGWARKTGWKSHNLILSNNNFSGSIPAQLSQAGNIYRLKLDGNGLSGNIPSALGSITFLRELDLSGNGLSGSIPSTFSGLTNLEVLGLSGNGLSGSIPSGLGGLTKLKSLKLDGNGLSGSVPSQLGGLTKLAILHLQGNTGLTGCVPASLSTYIRVSGIWPVVTEELDADVQVPPSLTTSGAVKWCAS